VLFGSIVPTFSIMFPHGPRVLASRHGTMDGINTTVNVNKQPFGSTTSSFQGTVLSVLCINSRTGSCIMMSICITLIGTSGSMVQNTKFGPIPLQLFFLLTLPLLPLQRLGRVGENRHGKRRSKAKEVSLSVTVYAALRSM
jgi:hypothetical protein